MKIFANVSIGAMLLTVALGVYAAAPEPELRQEWQKKTEAFLQGLHARTGEKSPVRTELGEYLTQMIARMSKPRGLITNNTRYTIGKFEISRSLSEDCTVSIIPPEDIVTITPRVNSILPGSSIYYDFEQISSILRGCPPQTSKLDSVDISFELKDRRTIIMEAVILHVNSNIEIKETEAGELRLIVSTPDEQPVAYKPAMVIEIPLFPNLLW